MNQTPDQRQADPMADTVAFPILSAAELEECAEFGTRCSFGAGEDLFRAGANPFDCYVILSGEVCIVDVSTDEPTYLIRLGGGQFTLPSLGQRRRSWFRGKARASLYGLSAATRVTKCEVLPGQSLPAAIALR